MRTIIEGILYRIGSEIGEILIILLLLAIFIVPAYLWTMWRKRKMAGK
jgi:hypothetical protein